MTSRALRCRRLELWSALQCAGGRRLAIWPDVAAAVATLTLGLDSSLTAEVPLDADATVRADRWLVVRVWDDDERWDEWILTSVATDEVAGRATLTASPVTTLLGRAGLVTEAASADGVVRPEVERVGLPPATLLRTLVVDACAALGLPWVQAGTVEPTAPIDVTLSWATPLQALATIADVAGCEVGVRRVGTSGYALDLVRRIGADAPVLDVRAGRNLTGLTQAAQSTEHATVIAGKGAVTDDVAATIARAVWRVAAIAGTRVTLADPAGGAGPIGWDDQLNGLALRREDGSRAAITSSRWRDQSVEVASVGTLAVGHLVEVCEADGRDVIALPQPQAVRDYGRLIGTIERPDVPGHRNRIPNPAAREWSGAASAPPDGWATVGSPTIARLESGPRLVRGPRAIQLTLDAAGEGILTPWAPCVASAAAPYLSGYLSIWVETGQVRVELVAETATAETRVYPLGGALATSAVQGAWSDLGLAGIDARAAGLVRARLRLVQHGTAPATVTVASAQLTLSSGDGQLPFVEGSGGTALWQAVNEALALRAVPRLVTEVTLADLARIQPETYALDSSITLGGTARVVSATRRIEGTARVVQVDRDLVVPGRTAIRLSDRPEDLGGSLARRTPVARRLPTPPPALLAGDVVVQSAFDGAGALFISVTAPIGSDSIRAAVSTVAMPGAAAVDAATGSLRADGSDVATLTAPGPFAEGQLVYIAVRAYRQGVGTRVVQTTDARDAADAVQGPSLQVRQAHGDTETTIRYTAIGTVTVRFNDADPVPAPASPFVVARPPKGAAAGSVTIDAVRNGETKTVAITIPPIDADTITPDLVVVPGAPTLDAQPFTVSATDPSGGAGGTLTRTMTLVGCEAEGFAGPGPHVLSNGQTVVIRKPLARPDASVKFRATLSAGSSAEASRTIPPLELTGRGRERHSNPQWDVARPARAATYTFGTGGLLSVTYVADAAAPNLTGRVLRVSKTAGGVAGDLNGFTISMQRTTVAGFLVDTYRPGGLYLVRVKAKVPIGLALHLATNGWSGGSWEPLTRLDGTGDWATYVWRARAGTAAGGDEVYIAVFGAGAWSFDVAECSFLDLDAEDRQPPVIVTTEVIASGADFVDVQVACVPALPASRVSLQAAAPAPTSGAAVGVEVPSGSVWRFPKTAFRSGEGRAFFGGRTPGFAETSVAFTIPEQGRDTVSILARVVKLAESATAVTVRVSGSAPFVDRDGSIIITELTGGTATLGGGPERVEGNVDPLTISTADRYWGSIGGAAGVSFRDYVIQKPPVGAANGRFSVRIAALDGSADPGNDGIDIPARTALVPGRIEPVTNSQSGALYTLAYRMWDARGVLLIAPNTGDGAFATLRVTPTVGAPYSVAQSVTYDPVNGWLFVDIVRPAGAALSLDLGFAERGDTARTAITVPIPTYLPIASGGGDAIVSTAVSADGGVQFSASAVVDAALVGATIRYFADYRYSGGGPDVLGAGVAGISLGEVGPLFTGPTHQPPSGGDDSVYIMRVLFEAYINSRLVGSAYGSALFYVDNGGT